MMPEMYGQSSVTLRHCRQHMQIYSPVTFPLLTYCTRYIFGLRGSHISAKQTYPTCIRTLQCLACHSPESGVLKLKSTVPRTSPIHILSLHRHSVACAVLNEGQIERQGLSRCHGSDCPIGQCDSVCEVRSALSAVQ